MSTIIYPGIFYKVKGQIKGQMSAKWNFYCLRNDIKSHGKIEGGWVKRANFGKIETKDRDY